LIPSDARLSHDVSLLEESAVSVTRMHDRIKAIGVGQVIVLLDACRNDPGGRADAPNNMSAAYAKFNFDVRNREVQAFATLYATAIGQRAYEYTEKRQGYFTWAVVEGLKGGAANDKGEVTLAALLKYVQNTVPKRIAIDLGPNEQQKPFATIEGYRADELIVAVSGSKLATNLNQPVTSGIDTANAEVSFWESIKNSADPEDLKDYLKRYPNGAFEGIAKRRIQAMATNSLAAGRENDSPADLAGTIWENKDESRGIMNAVFIYEFLPDGTYQTRNPNAPKVSGGGTWKQEGNHLLLKESNLTIEGILDGDRINAEFYSSGRRTSLMFTRKGVSRRIRETPEMPLPTVDEILEANVRALGGKTAFEKLTTLSLRGLLEVSAAGKTYNGTTEMYVKFPDKSLSINVVPKLEKSTQGFDGTVGWRKDERGVALMNAWQNAFLKRNTVLSYLTDTNQLKAVYPKSRLKGKEKVGNREAYVLEVEPLDAKPETLYFDTETGLVIRWDLLYQSADAQKGVGIPMQLYIDDYVDANGVKVAAVIRQVTPGITFITRFFDVKYNVPIDDARFSKPK